MQGQQVQHVLQVVAVIQNRGGHRLFGVGRIIRAQGQGVFFTRPPRLLIESLDLMFQGKPLPKTVEPAWEQGVLL